MFVNLSRDQEKGTKSYCEMNAFGLNPLFDWSLGQLPCLWMLVTALSGVLLVHLLSLEKPPRWPSG